MESGQGEQPGTWDWGHGGDKPGGAAHPLSLSLSLSKMTADLHHWRSELEAI